MNHNEPSEEEKNRWINDPDNWIWGMFYYNPKDKRSYFPKRINEFGWHANFANPIFIVIITLFVLIILAFIRNGK